MPGDTCAMGLMCLDAGDATYCTKTCMADADCPAGSMGMKCNRRGFCRQ
jgi:hypothetical protein